MNATHRAVYEARAKVMKALAHPARLLVLDALQAGPRCVCDLRELVGSDLSTVSKHLSVLKNADLVRDERRGVQVYYALRCPCIGDFFRCAETVLAAAAAEHARAAHPRGRP
jgi:ArsR family transcriptional regulator